MLTKKDLIKKVNEWIEKQIQSGDNITFDLTIDKSPFGSNLLSLKLNIGIKD